MNKTVERDLPVITAAIREVAEPKRISLFGSQVSGAAGLDSDIDLCVITDDPGRKIELLRSIRAKLFRKVDTPVDMVIYKSEDFRRRAAVVGGFEWTIEHDGTAVYG